jgi:hypothetical protein
MIGLKAFTERYLGVTLVKDKQLTLGAWDRALSPLQIACSYTLHFLPLLRKLPAFLPSSSVFSDLLIDPPVLSLLFLSFPLRRFPNCLPPLPCFLRSSSQTQQQTSTSPSSSFTPFASLLFPARSLKTGRSLPSPLPLSLHLPTPVCHQRQRMQGS